MSEVRLKGIELKTAAQIAKLREANLIVSDVLDAIGDAAAIGVSTWDLELVARRRLKELAGRIGLPWVSRLSRRCCARP